MKNRIRQALFSLAKLLIAGGLIYWMIERGFLDLKDLKGLLSPFILFALLALAFLNLTFANFRWMLLLRAQELPFEWRRTMPLTLIGIFFNFAMPGGVGGDVIKAYYLLRDHPEQRSKALTTVMMDRFFGFLAMVLLALFAMAFRWQDILANDVLKWLAFFTFLVFVGFVGFLCLLFSKRLQRAQWLQEFLRKVPGGGVIGRLYSAAAAYRNPQLIASTVGLSFVAQIFAVIFIFSVGRLLGFSDLSLASCFVAVPMGFIAMALPVAPAGIGVGQAAFMFLFDSLTSVSSDMGPNAITAFQSAQLAWGLLGAYFYLRRRGPILREVSV